MSGKKQKAFKGKDGEANEDLAGDYDIIQEEMGSSAEFVELSKRPVTKQESGGSYDHLDDRQDTVYEEKELTDGFICIESSTEKIAVVQDEDGKEMEVPIDKDYTLGLTSLNNAFPGLSGLKYKNPSTGAIQVLHTDSAGLKFTAPPDGWADKVFLVITQKGDSGSPRDAKEVEGEEKKEPSDLIIRNIPYRITDEEFKKYFEQFGTVVKSKLDLNKDPNPRGIIRMSSLEEQKKILDRVDLIIDNRKLKVKVYNRKENTKSVIHVGGLPEKITPGNLQAFFEEEIKKRELKVKITSVRITFRGHGFVSLDSQEMAERIVNQNDFVFKGASLKVSLAPARKPKF